MRDFYYIENETLALKNGLMKIKGVKDAKWAKEDGNGLSLPFVKVKAESSEYIMWEDLPLIYIKEWKGGIITSLKGEHTTLKTVKLHANTDNNDTLATSEEADVYKGAVYGEKKGDLFFFEDNETGKALVIISETPDYECGMLSVKDKNVFFENGGNGVALGLCEKGMCEYFVREYYRHARKSEPLFTMGNIWGGGNGRKCANFDFMKREIDAAKEMEVDAVQIDDGWQVGSTLDLTRRDELDRRCFYGDFWEVNKENFPGGMKKIADYAKEKGIIPGLWFAPDSHDNFYLMERDAKILEKAYSEWGFKLFKLDMLWVSNPEEKQRFRELLEKIYSFGKDVSVQLDVTLNLRTNYLWGKEFGTVFVENRYTHTGVYFPHRTLKNVWTIGKYIPLSKLQFEIPDPDRNPDKYDENDIFAPKNYDMDYLFATVMLSNPLFWMEMQNLSEKRKEELRRIVPVWKEMRDFLGKADIEPVGDKPSGRSHTGFIIRKGKKAKYLLLFREETEKEGARFKADISCSDANDFTILASNGNFGVEISEGEIAFTSDKPKSYALIKL